MTAIQQLWHCEQPYVDPYWAYVRTLLHFNGNTTDESTSNVTYGNANGASINGSLQLDGSGCLDTRSDSNARCSGASSALALGTSNFCIEVWFKDSPEIENSSGIFLTQGATSQTIRLYTAGNGILTADASGGGPGAGVVGFSMGAWVHAAITRNGNNFTLWVNGAVGLTWTNSTFNGGSGATTLWIASHSSADSGFTGLLDSFRVTIGVPRYTAPFVPMTYWPNRGP